MENLAVDCWAANAGGAGVVLLQSVDWLRCRAAGHLYGRGRDDRLRPAAGPNPRTLLLGAAAQSSASSPPCAGGADAELLRPDPLHPGMQAAAIGIIGGVTARRRFYLCRALAPELLGPSRRRISYYGAFAPLTSRRLRKR